MTLWSVVVTHLTTVWPGSERGGVVRRRWSTSSVDPLGVVVAAVIVSSLRAVGASSWSACSSWLAVEVVVELAGLADGAAARPCAASYSAWDTTLTLKSICEW